VLHARTGGLGTAQVTMVLGGVRWQHDDSGVDEWCRGKLGVLTAARVVVDDEYNGLGELNDGWLLAAGEERGGGATASRQERWCLGESCSRRKRR
jgi:hypothetical protein